MAIILPELPYTKNAAAMWRALSKPDEKYPGYQQLIIILDK